MAQIKNGAHTREGKNLFYSGVQTDHNHAVIVLSKIKLNALFYDPSSVLLIVWGQNM